MATATSRCSRTRTPSCRRGSAGLAGARAPRRRRAATRARCGRHAGQLHCEYGPCWQCGTRCGCCVGAGRFGGPLRPGHGARGRWRSCRARTTCSPRARIGWSSSGTPTAGSCCSRSRATTPRRAACAPGVSAPFAAHTPILTVSGARTGAALHAVFKPILTTVWMGFFDQQVPCTLCGSAAPA